MMGRYLEAFETSMIGQMLPDISRKDKIDILVEGIKSFQSLLGMIFKINKLSMTVLFLILPHQIEIQL